MTHTTKTLVLAILSLFLFAGTVFAVTPSTSLTAQRQVAPSSQWENGTPYEVALPYAHSDPLFSFVKNENGIQLSTNCAFVSGCHNFGTWNNPFQLNQKNATTYDLFYNEATIKHHYQFRVQPSGKINVFVSHDQCYPAGCQNPPLKFVGTFIQK